MIEIIHNVLYSECLNVCGIFDATWLMYECIRNEKNTREAFQNKTLPTQQHYGDELFKSDFIGLYNVVHMFLFF